MFAPTVRFLADLAAHNDKAWFEANRARFDADVKAPAVRFVETMAPRLARRTPHLAAVAGGAGSSISRIHRDTRFSADKSPYKDWLGVHFFHTAGKEAPGLHLRVSPDGAAVGVGVWQLEPAALAAVRARVADVDAWPPVRAALDAGGFSFIGASLKRVPRGFPPDHPAAEDLRRQTFGAGAPVDPALPDDAFADAVEAAWDRGWPLLAFLCDALDQPL